MSGWPIKKDTEPLKDCGYEEWEKRHKKCRKCIYFVYHGRRSGCNYNVVHDKTRMAEDREACIASYWNSENCKWFESGKRKKQTKAMRLDVPREKNATKRGIAFGDQSRRPMRKLPVDAAGADGEKGNDRAKVHAPKRAERRGPDPRAGFERIRDPRGLLVQKADVVHGTKVKGGGNPPKPVMKLNIRWEIEEIYESQYAAAKACELYHKTIQSRVAGKTEREFHTPTFNYTFRDAKLYVEWLEEQNGHSE